MKKFLLLFAGLCSVAFAMAQTDVTKTMLQNADFQARFAGWTNPGSFTYQIANTFEKSSGDIWMEKWVKTPSTLGNNDGIYQVLRNMPEGTYTLTVAGRNINQNNTSQVCKGAFLYAGNKQTEISVMDDYSVEFTAVEGEDVTVGVKLTSCNGNWVSIDNFRLTKKEASAEDLAARKAELEAAEQDLRDKIANATGAVPTATTNKYVAMGTTIALARATYTGTSIKERGVCWSTEHNPTIFDHKTTSRFTEMPGFLFRMEGLQPATIYYVRAYAITSGNQLAYGNEVKFATMPKGNMALTYNPNDATDEQTKRIRSASEECVWMYNNLCNITNFTLKVNYSYGSGAGGGTADCSYGGYMRVSQNTPYQQTGTMLHETNHGVGVGTTGEWYNNANLRSNTSSGKWLGPRATKMVRFLENNEGAYMQGDGTHMWAGTTSGTLKYGYGINGAQEDSYQPSNQMLYYGNVFITHAMHQDGLISTSGRGFATPCYAFVQDDTTKYYIRSENKTPGMTAFLGVTPGARASQTNLRNVEMSVEDALKNDSMAWYIAYNPKTCYYSFKNVGTGKFLSGNSTATSAAYYHLMPARNTTTMGKYKGDSFWILNSSTHAALSTATSATNTAGYAPYYGLSTPAFDATNSADNQRWFLLTADEVKDYDAGAATVATNDLKNLIKNVKALVDTGHESTDESVTTESVDGEINEAIENVEGEMANFTNCSQVVNATDNIMEALTKFLASARPASMDAPFDLTFLVKNAKAETTLDGWTAATMPAIGNSCCEYYQKNFTLSQTIGLTLPAGTYKACVQAFNRPGTSAAVYADYSKGTDNSKAYFYFGTTSNKVKVKNICADPNPTSVDGAVSVASGVYIPNNMASAHTFFLKKKYENELFFSNTADNAKMQIGLTLSNSADNYWTCFTNFRLYSYGTYTKEDITGVENITAPSMNNAKVYDLSGRRVQDSSAHGIYIINGKKVIR